jgi:hypothetical protein
VQWVNEGPWDRGIRIVLGIILLAVGLAYQPALAWLWDVIGAILLLTGLSGFCLVYRIFGINTTGVHSHRTSG